MKIPDDLLRGRFNIIANDIITTRKEYVWLRRPKSKKRRVRKKWRKNRDNWRMETKYKVIRYGNILYVPTKIYEMYKEQAK